ncbi:hypothetical protein FACS1894206_02870 [Deltaproteobacteria bacterium]|nr:hypothetical protein FACS1894206_02870 [Deltaproteobacteria bacterium]
MEKGSLTRKLSKETPRHREVFLRDGVASRDGDTAICVMARIILWHEKRQSRLEGLEIV